MTPEDADELATQIAGRLKMYAVVGHRHPDMLKQKTREVLQEILTEEGGALVPADEEAIVEAARRKILDNGVAS